MMKVLYVPQMNDNYQFTYEFDKEVVVVRLYKFEFVKDGSNKILTRKFIGLEEYDFTNMPNGIMKNSTSKFLYNPVISAKRNNGELYIKLLNFIMSNEEDKKVLFPDWVNINNE